MEVDIFNKKFTMMKKLFKFMVILAAMTMITVSCSKDDDKDSTDNRLKFATALTQNGTSGTWEG